MPAMQSAAMTLLLQAGVATDPVDRTGSATVLSDLVLRGEPATRQPASDRLSRHPGASAVEQCRRPPHAVWLCGPGRQGHGGLACYADIVRRPHLPEDGFEAAHDLPAAGLGRHRRRAAHKLMIKLREWHFPSPLRPKLDGKEGPSGEADAGLVQGRPRPAISSPSTRFCRSPGNIDFEQVHRRSREALWRLGRHERHRRSRSCRRPATIHHEHQQSEQTHIGMAWPSVPGDRSRLLHRSARGRSSQRRHERPAVYRSPREARPLLQRLGRLQPQGPGRDSGYAGTSNDRAQATLDCFFEELHRLTDGVTDAELDRAKTGLKAGTIMQGESTSARAGAIAHDYFIRGRIRTFEEIKAAIDGVTVDQVNAYLKRTRPVRLRSCTVGPKESEAFPVTDSETTIGSHFSSQATPQRPRHHRRGQPRFALIRRRAVRQDRLARRVHRRQRRLALPRAHDVQGLEQIHLGRRQPHLRRDRRDATTRSPARR